MTKNEYAWGFDQISENIQKYKSEGLIKLQKAAFYMITYLTTPTPQSQSPGFACFLAV